jgi:hypothetical protein
MPYVYRGTSQEVDLEEHFRKDFYNLKEASDEFARLLEFIASNLCNQEQLDELCDTSNVDRVEYKTAKGE